MAASFLTLLGRMPQLAEAYVFGSCTTPAATEAVGLPEIDPNGWLLFGGPGALLLVANALARHGCRLPT